MASNSDVLRDVWVRLKEQELEKTSNLMSNKKIWNELFYYTISSISDYLCRDEDEMLPNLRSRLEFSGKFLETLPKIQLDDNTLFGDEELILFSATAYSFAGFPGASSVTLRNLRGTNLSFVEKVLAEVLNYGQSSFPWEKSRIGLTMAKVFSGKDDIETLYQQADALVEESYQRDDDIDIIASECVRAVINSCWERATINLMPSFSDTTTQSWASVVSAGKLHPVLWKAQRELGIHNVFRGNSAVVQLPTGSGKTASFSLILRSGLYRGSFHVAIVVAPFKSIRDEIYLNLKQQFTDEDIDINQISTELKIDLSDFTYKEQPAILVVTPEKLLFMIQHDTDFLAKVGLFIFDEAHQLDDNERGITFELLLSTINLLVGENVQKVFVSAVIGNPKEVSDWFNNGNNDVVKELTQRKYGRVLGYSKWSKSDLHGQLFIWNRLDSTRTWIEFPEFFNAVKIKKGKYEPDFMVENHTVGIRWATALTASQFINAGMVAVFAPRKDTINALSKVFVRYEKLSAVLKSTNSLMNELDNLFTLNFGEDSVLVKAYRAGIYIHDGDIPDGIRNCLELEAHRGNIRLMLCTNTLAQGVNLPIKTLIIASVGNGNLELSMRSAINLVGRAGRSGVLNESNIIFMQNSSPWSDKRAKQLLKKLAIDTPANSLESSLASLFMPTALYAYGNSGEVIEPTDWCTADFLDDPITWIKNTVKAIEQNSSKLADDYRKVFLEKANGIWKIENYLMSVWNVIEDGNLDDNIEVIVRKTFASTRIANNELKLMIATFQYLGQKISLLNVQGRNVTVMGKMMVGVNEALEMEDYINTYEEIILTKDDLEQVVSDIWPILEKAIPINNPKHNNLYRLLLNGWITGKSYSDILGSWKASFPEERFSNRLPSVEKVYQICNNVFQFDMQLKVSSLMELVTDPNKYARLERLQRAMKTGLSQVTENSFYEAGINDRVLATLFAKEMDVIGANRAEASRWMHQNRERLIADFGDIIPEYFRMKL